MPYTDSASATATLTLRGLWLHDPLDPAGTVTVYLYGPPKDSTIATMPAGTLYSGRTYPVIDYGEHEEETVSVVIHVPYGSTYQADMTTLRAWARIRRTVWLRDSRGRSLPGVLSDFRIGDQRWGSAVTWSHGHVDYAVEEVSA
jgi:hypothetical protein